MNQNKVFLGSKSFNLDIQVQFSKLSGDVNPIHLDYLESRKSITGECIVHGMHSFLWAIELLVSNVKYLFNEYDIRFKKYIPLNTTVNCFWDDFKKELTIEKDKEVIFVLIKCSKKIFFNKKSDKWLTLLHEKILKRPLEFNINKINSERKYNSIYGGEIDISEDLFPKLCNYTSKNLIYEISNISNIIGMQVPGLNSLFISCKIHLKKNMKVIPQYSLNYFHQSIRLLEIEYTGKNIISKMEAFIAPKNDSINIQNHLKNDLKNKNCYKGKKILVLGGSRGIGSFLVKVINLLGGDIMFTYNKGEDEAKKISKYLSKINSTNPCKFTKFDVLNDCYDNVFKENYDYLFYFATSKIFGKNGKDFDDIRFQEFKKIYCDSFKKISEIFIKKGGKNIFYPSTVAVNENVTGIEEYKLAKQEGELVCKKIKEKHNINLLIKRLPRILTDQTLTLMPAKSLSPLDVAIEIAFEMNK